MFFIINKKYNLNQCATISVTASSSSMALSEWQKAVPTTYEAPGIHYARIFGGKKNQLQSISYILIFFITVQ